MSTNDELRKLIAEQMDFALSQTPEALAAENAKLRELVECVLVLRHDPVYKWLDTTFAEVFGKSFTEQARELGMEEDE